MSALVKKNDFNFEFQASTFNQRLTNMYVLKLIQWQNLKRKIVAVSLFLTTLIFANIAKISNSVDLNFCIGVIGRNAKRTRLFPFSVNAPRNNVGGRHSDNFKGTGRAHSSF